MTKIPDRNKFLADLNNAIDQFIDRSYEKVIAISHNDADGISSLHIIQNLLYRMNLAYDYFIYNRSVSWSNYLQGILSKEQSNKIALIFTDVGSNLNELIPIISNRKEDFYILDHHEVDANLSNVKIPENLKFVNPTIHGFDGLDHIAGSTLAYMFAKKIKPKPVKKLGWLTVIGIAGDTLRSTDKLQSFNREIYEELVNEGLIEDKEGLILFGSMHESIKNGLKYSILPFIKGLGGEEDDILKPFLKSLQINPNTKVIDLSPIEIQRIQEEGHFDSFGHYSILPQKQGILKFAFEHALLLNILCFKNINAAVSMVQRKSTTFYAKGIYYEYIFNLVKNLKTLVKLPRFETKEAIFIEAGDKIPASNWSDTASFSMVNELLDPYKVLFLGDEEKRNHTIKLSIRCTRKYLEKSGTGVNVIIQKIKEELGGMGGGHKLAGGLRLSKPSFNRLKENISKYM
ncbi:MAG: DHH family phosphoesterase [Promethearchaeota archaeon]|nr:MAG: DHH family phosphoesterase [Candidatus Lokiarchaeota archaeon]